jgi:RNA polymerase sigma factor (sigma-70 family)
MATATLHPLIRHIRRVVGAPSTADLPDARLLAGFATCGDETAFAVLVRRHGPLVFGVCRRVLGDWHAAEDAFQEVFALLARRAGSLRQPDQLGPWLHGVAHRTALKARGQAVRRHACERKAMMPSAVDPTDDLVWRDLRPVLDDAVARLPEKHRLPFVLHYLQGDAVDVVACRLGWPRGTVATRLARARAQLRQVLARQGLTVSGTALAAVLSAGTVSATVPSSLVTVAIQAATRAGAMAVTGTAVAGITLTQGGWNVMFSMKWKCLAAVLFVVALTVGGAGLLTPGSGAEKQGDAAAPAGEGEGGQPPEKPRQPDRLADDAAAQAIRDRPARTSERPSGDVEEAIYRALREQGHWQAGGGFTVFVKRLQGRRLLDVEIRREAGAAADAKVARARAATLKLDRKKGVVLFDLTTVAFAVGDDALYADQMTLPVPLPAPVAPSSREARRVLEEKLSAYEARPPMRFSPMGVAFIPAGNVIEEKPRQYQLQLLIVRVDAGGEDFGPHGKGEVLGRPRLVTLDDQDARYQVGQQIMVPGDEPGTTEFLTFGLAVQMKVKRLGDGRLRLDVAMEHSEVEPVGTKGRGGMRDSYIRPEAEPVGTKGWRLQKTTVAATERVKFGEEVKLVEKDAKGKAVRWALVRVLRMGSGDSRTGPPQAQPTEDKRANISAYVIAPPDVLLVQTARGMTPSAQNLDGQHLVRPDGTIGLGTYGAVHVAGMTIEQARLAVARSVHSRLKPAAKGLKEVLEGVSVDVVAYNSKVCYVIVDPAGQGEKVYRLPVTGKETVLDAVAQIEGLPPEASRYRMWVERMGKAGAEPELLPVDWRAITQQGEVSTNYQLLPGDRLHVKTVRK